MKETTVAIHSKAIDAPITESHQIENAPVLQILNNNVISRTDGFANRVQDAAAIKDISPKAMAARNELLKFIPPRSDMVRIRDIASHWWSAWIHMFPELLQRNKESLTGRDDIFDVPKSPGEVAKFIICHLMCLEQLPAGFDFSTLEMPIDPPQYTEQCIAAIDRLVIYDEDLSGTLPGLEAMGLLSKWYMNLGRPRKSWLLIRRAIELAQLAGLHISTARDPLPNDTLYDRRLKLWTMLGLLDRFLSLILGLPHGIQESQYLPQVERRLKEPNPNMETYCLRLSIVMGRMIDRNQEDPTKMSIAETLKLEQDLENQARAMPPHFWQEQMPDRDMPVDEAIERLMLPFTYNYMRATLHLPFMLQSHGDRRYKYSHEAALESARNALLSYNKLRTWDRMNPFICRIIDFQAFSVAMLLIINIVGYSDEHPDYSDEQIEKDWALVDATTAVLRRAAAEPAGTVAAQSLLIIEGLSKNVCPEDMEQPVSCKVSVPYFGVVTVTPGKKKLKSRPKRPGDQPTPGSCSFSSTPNQSSSSKICSSEQASPFQLYTPPQTNIDFSTTSSSSGTNKAAPGYANIAPPFPDDPRIQLENILSLPNAGLMDQNHFMDFTAANNEDLGLWSNMNLDLDLDQGWNLDWTNMNGTMM